MLRGLRRRNGRTQDAAPLTYRELADRTGWSRSVIGDYLTGRVLPPADRFDQLIQLLGATPAEQRALATARDRVDEGRRAQPADRAGRPRARGGPGHVVPRQLPSAVPGFTGRGAELSLLDSLLDGTATTPVCVVDGMAGVGKTTLALYWGHRVADRFPDGQLYVNLRGFDATGPAMEPAEAIRRFLDALEVPPQRIPTDPDAAAALYRAELAGRRVLLVLDNARDTAQVQPLLPGTPGGLVVITSRNRLTALVADGARPIGLDLFTGTEARDVLRHRLGKARVGAEPAAVDELVAYCARLPLALAIAAAHAAAYPWLPLAHLAGELRAARRRLAVLSGDDPPSDVRAVFSWSYRALTPDAARLFRLLGAYPGPDIGIAAVASLAALAVVRVRPLLAELGQANLLVEPVAGRYALHDLLRAYATELAGAEDTEAVRRAATHRLLDHYLHTAYAADRLVHPARDPLTPPAAEAGATPEHLTDHPTALDWFTTEHAVLVAAVEYAAAAGFDDHAWQLAWSLRTFLNRRGYWHDQAAVGRTAVAAAQRLGDLPTRARTHRNLAGVYIRLGRLDDAHAQLGYALDLTTRAGDQAGQAHTHYHLGLLWDQRGEPAQAVHHTGWALELFGSAGHRVGQANALNNLGWYHAALGDHERSLAFCQRALALHQELDDRFGQASTWDSLGYAHHHLGDHGAAATCYHEALSRYRDLGDRYNEADVLTHLGDTHHATGDAEAARDTWRRALAIFDELDHPDAQRVRARLAPNPAS